MIQPGDIVECVDNTNWKEKLIIGRKYEVREVYKDALTLCGINFVIEPIIFREFRFRKVEK